MKKVRTLISLLYYDRFPFRKTFHQNCSLQLNNCNQIDIVTVAFNNAKVIRWQIDLLKKFLRDRFSYTVADNSSVPEISSIIQRACAERGVGYIKLPKNPFRIGSESHGCAINWVYRNYIRPRGAAYFGFIDHDIFPIKSTSVINFLAKSPVFGYLQERDRQWYLWAGFCFFSRSFVDERELNFMPGHHCDTGGRNWQSLYARLDKKTLPKLTTEYVSLRPGSDPQSDMVELIGDWVHIFNASGWKKVESKENLVEKFIQQF